LYYLYQIYSHCKYFMPKYQEKNMRDFLRVKRSASGLGLFTTKDIMQGTFIMEYTGNLISTQQAESRGGRYLFKINSKWAVDGKGRENMSRYINHFCQPNCEVQISKKMVLIYASRDIEKGEELGYDYGAEYFLAHIKTKGCKCPYCRFKKIIES